MVAGAFPEEGRYPYPRRGPKPLSCPPWAFKRVSGKNSKKIKGLTNGARTTVSPRLTARLVPCCNSARPAPARDPQNEAVTNRDLIIATSPYPGTDLREKQPL